jgi:hypothetical protein
MNISFSPLWLWPVPVVLILLSWAWQRIATRRKVRGLPWRLGIGTLIGLVAAWDLFFFSFPPIRGQVLDLKTGKPVTHAQVQRSLYRQRPFTLEQYPVTFVRGSFLETSTDADGKFTFPGWISVWPTCLRGLCGMAWLVYAQDYMPAYGCWAAPFGHRARGCAAFATPEYPDPWTRFGGRSSASDATIEVATTRNESPESWAEAFRRMNYLLQVRRIQVEQAVEVVLGFAARFPITEEQVREVYRILSGLGSIQADGSHYKAREGLNRIQLVDAYCRSHLDSKFCEQNKKAIDFDKDYFAKAAAPQ